MDLHTWWLVTAGLSQSYVLEPKGRRERGMGDPRPAPGGLVLCLDLMNLARGGVLSPAEVKS